MANNSFGLRTRPGTRVKNVFLSSGAVIKSVTTGLVTISNTSTSATLALPTVVVANTIVFVSGSQPSSATDGSSNGAWAVVTNTTTATVTRTGTSGNLIVSVTAIEFHRGVLRSNQDFTVSITAGLSENTATITAVVTGKTIVVSRGLDYDTADVVPGNTMGSLTLTNTTTVTGTRPNTNNQLRLYGTAVEFA